MFLSQSRSDIATLVKMLKFKFGQSCPVYQIRVTSFSFGTSHLIGSSHSTASTEGTKTLSRHSINYLQEVPQPQPEVDSKEREITSYQKTIETLTKELDELRSRVRDLEQMKLENQNLLAKEKEKLAGVVMSGIQQEELRKDLEAEREEKENYKQLLQEETDKVYTYPLK